MNTALVNGAAAVAVHTSAVPAWVFVRRPTAKTLAGQAPGRCPNCGAPYDGGDYAVTISGRPAHQ